MQYFSGVLVAELVKARFVWYRCSLKGWIVRCEGSNPIESRKKSGENKNTKEMVKFTKYASKIMKNTCLIGTLAVKISLILWICFARYEIFNFYFCQFWPKHFSLNQVNIHKNHVLFFPGSKKFINFTKITEMAINVLIIKIFRIS